MTDFPELTKWFYVARGLGAAYGYSLPGDHVYDEDSIVAFIPLEANINSSEYLYPAMLDEHWVEYVKIPAPQAY